MSRDPELRKKTIGDKQMDVSLGSDFFSFYLMSLLCSRIPPEYPFCHYVSFGSSWCDNSSDLLSFWRSWQFWEVLQVFCRLSLHWDLSDICSMIRLGVCVFWWEDYRDEVPFSSDHIKHIFYQCTLTLLVWILIKESLTNFSSVKLLFFSPFYTMLFGRKLLCAAHT